MNVQLESNPRLRGRVLFVMRVVWGMVTLVCIVTLIASLPPYFDALRRPGEAIRAGLTQVGLSADLFAGVSLGGQVVSAAIFILVSLVIVWRTPHDRMAWFVAFALTTFGAAGPTGTPYSSMFQALIARQPDWFPLTALLSALGWVLIGFFILLFPDGRLVPRWTWVFGLEWIIFNCLWFFFPNSPFSPPNWPPALFIVGVGFNFLTALFAQVYRYRYVSNPVQRQQTKRLVLGSGLVIALNLVFLTPAAAAQVYRYSAANLNAIVPQANQSVGAGGFSASFPANSITLVVIPPATPPLRLFLPSSGGKRRARPSRWIAPPPTG
jgi:hypothetical protein